MEDGVTAMRYFPSYLLHFLVIAECAFTLGSGGVEWARAALPGGGERAAALLAKLLLASGDIAGALAAYDQALS